MGLGGVLMDIFSPLMEFIAPVMPGEVFPFFFTMELFQRALLAAIMVTIVAGFLGTFLLIRNLALIGDGLAHVSFGGVAVGIVLGATSPLWYALIFSITAAILIHEMQSREILTGDASIAIFLTGMLALGLVTLRIWGGGITSDIHGYLFGNLLLIDEADLDMISFICVVSLVLLILIRSGLLATTVDPLSARVQGLPVRGIGLLFSVITAAVVVSMVQVVGTLLVTALLVTPAATAQLVGRSFRSCLLWTQVFGLSSVLLGLYFSAEYSSGSGSMIALIAAIIFASVAILQIIIRNFIRPKENYSNN
ncbi:MAG: metal ABC transporter permease [Candidatus Thalassarchaeaceae archaeon]|jgi:zinc transport system permease protein|nr:metal ABC transporter permease [Candidatus Thalassarchaeaceae archaeon]|tara:strand:- start:106 stop:1029 length:924 start_codon:yes stop_codon:yes gene_type:complete